MKRTHINSTTGSGSDAISQPITALFNALQQPQTTTAVPQQAPYTPHDNSPINSKNCLGFIMRVLNFCIPLKSELL